MSEISDSENVIFPNFGDPSNDTKESRKNRTAEAKRIAKRQKFIEKYALGNPFLNDPSRRPPSMYLLNKLRVRYPEIRHEQRSTILARLAMLEGIDENQYSLFDENLEPIDFNDKDK